MANAPYPKLAEFALAAIAQVTVKADDDSLAAVQATRAMLRAIQQGQLVVVEPSALPQLEE